MSGGKGGSKTQETTIPDWIRGPAERNLQRAEAVQQIPYMPYYGPDVAAFTPAQNAAFQGNIGAAEAFGLLAPGTLTPTSGMPEPTEYAGGFTGYSSQPMYEQALAELKAKQPGAVAQYDALFGNAVPANNFGGGGGGSRFRGSANQSKQRYQYNPDVGRPQILPDGTPLPPAYGNMEQFKDSGYNANLPGGGISDDWRTTQKPATVIPWGGVSPGHPSLQEGKY